MTIFRIEFSSYIPPVRENVLEQTLELQIIGATIGIFWVGKLVITTDAVAQRMQAFYTLHDHCPKKSQVKYCTIQITSLFKGEFAAHRLHKQLTIR